MIVFSYTQLDCLKSRNNRNLIAASVQVSNLFCFLDIWCKEWAIGKIGNFR